MSKARNQSAGLNDPSCSIPTSSWNTTPGKNVVTVRAFRQDYLIDHDVLIKSQYFARLLEEHPNGSGVVYELTFDDKEKMVSSHVFEVAVAHMYGTQLEEICSSLTLDTLYGLLIVSGLLELSNLFDETVDAIVGHITFQNVAGIIRYCVNHDYGETTQRILSAATQFLRFHGTDVSVHTLLAVPADILLGVLAHDGFYATNEFERCKLIIRLYQSTKSRRLRERLAQLLNSNIYFCHMSEEHIIRLQQTAKDLIEVSTFDRHKKLKAIMKQAIQDARNSPDLSASIRDIPPLRFGASIILDHLVELGDHDYFLAGNRLTPCLLLSNDDSYPDELSLQMCIVRRSMRIAGCQYEYEDLRPVIKTRIALYTSDFTAERDADLPIWKSEDVGPSLSHNERVNISELSHRPIRASFAITLV